MKHKVEQKEKKTFKFDLTVEGKYLNVHAEIHLLYLLLGIIAIGIISLGVYLVQ